MKIIIAAAAIAAKDLCKRTDLRVDPAKDVLSIVFIGPSPVSIIATRISPQPFDHRGRAG
jgi:hypothetical protein